MNEYENKNKKPFKVGQLVHCKYSPQYNSLCLVLDLEWDEPGQCWLVRYLHQKRGHIDWLRSIWFEAAELCAFPRGRVDVCVPITKKTRTTRHQNTPEKNLS